MQSKDMYASGSLFEAENDSEKHIYEIIQEAEDRLNETIRPYKIKGLNKVDRERIFEHFENSSEFKVKIYREETAYLVRIYPVGKLKRLAEEKTQEVLMKGRQEELQPMGSFERFVIHDYLKERSDIKTESIGEPGKDRRIVITPLFGRKPRKAKRRRLI